MEAIIKEVVAEYAKMDLASINENTPIDRSSLKSSIMVHRMYGALANKGVIVIDYVQMKTYGELLKRINAQSASPLLLENDKITIDTVENKSISIGIDMEEVAKFPHVSDFREDAFYSQNFSPHEISYCIVQPDPLLSFAGLFATKEAIVKTNNQYKEQPFHKIEISHNAQGKPVFNGFSISISHIENSVVAVAVQEPSIQPVDTGIEQKLLATHEKLEAIQRKLSTYTKLSYFFLFTLIVLVAFYVFKYLG
jgi:phosphopantetheine--protein transferase-like protein